MRGTATVVSMAALAAMVPARAAEDSLAALRRHSRVAVAIAPTITDPAIRVQRRLFAGRERDRALVVAGDDTPAGAGLRRRFGGEGFVAVLVGKDGAERLRSPVPIGRDALFPAVDAMPMRRDETTRRP